MSKQHGVRSPADKAYIDRFETILAEYADILKQLRVSLSKYNRVPCLADDIRRISNNLRTLKPPARGFHPAHAKWLLKVDNLDRLAQAMEDMDWEAFKTQFIALHSQS